MTNTRELAQKALARSAELHKEQDQEIDRIKDLLHFSGLNMLFCAEDYAMSPAAFIKRVNKVLDEHGIEMGEF